MPTSFSLAHLTVLGCAPDQMVHVAANAGYDHVSIRLIPLWTPGEPAYLPENKAMLHATRVAIAATGVTVLDLERARIRRDIDPKSFLPAMEAAAELGARHVISSAWTSERNDRDFVVERYGEICDLAAPFGLTVDLEFPSFSRLTNLQEAADVVRTAARPNGGIAWAWFGLGWRHLLYPFESNRGICRCRTCPATCKNHWRNLHPGHCCDKA